MEELLCSWLDDEILLIPWWVFDLHEGAKQLALNITVHKETVNYQIYIQIIRLNSKVVD